LYYCIVSIHLYSISCSAHQSEALPVRETQREQRAVLRERKEALGSPFKAHQLWLTNYDSSFINRLQWRSQRGKSGHGPPSKLAMEFGLPSGAERVMIALSKC